ncbi:MAG TPA: methyltransferase domain-containing protein [Bacteroidales bacterium]|nr:methyltransferase domain-containing protein [Bacteroidales bacterium]
MSKILNFIFLPIRLIFSHETVNRLGLRSLRDERYDIVKKNINGRLIDIGCGNNELVKTYGRDSIGVDVYDFGGGALIIEDTSNLPFDDQSFDSVSFVACFNHIINREEVLKESFRLLKQGGRIYMTMLSPFWGVLRHKLAWWDPDQHERGMEEGEAMGLSTKYLVSLFDRCGFELVKRERFILGINNLYVFEKKS